MPLLHTLYRFNRSWTVVLATAAAVLAPVPGHAVVIKAGSSPEEDARLEAESHEAGKKQKSVVGILTGFVGEPANGFSGVYLGLAKDGRTGLVLTCGHGFPDVKGRATPQEGEQWVITFGPRRTQRHSDGAIRVLGTRVTLHPAYAKPGVDWKVCEGIRCGILRGYSVNDLAILEFNAERVKEGLERAGVEPALVFEDSSGFSGSLMEGQFFGFGTFGTQTSPGLENPEGRIHSGHTYVSYQSHRGRTAFISWNPQASGDAPPSLLSGDQRNGLSFSLVDTETEFLNPGDAKGTKVRSHPDQALHSPGDSGGPLFFKTDDGLRLAGIITSSTMEELVEPKTKTQARFHCQFFEPVMPNLKWIRAIQEGDGIGEAADLFRPAWLEESKVEWKIPAVRARAEAAPVPGHEPFDVEKAYAQAVSATAGSDRPGQVHPPERSTKAFGMRTPRTLAAWAPVPRDAGALRERVKADPRFKEMVNLTLAGHLQVLMAKGDVKLEVQPSEDAAHAFRNYRTAADAAIGIAFQIRKAMLADTFAQGGSEQALAEDPEWGEEGVRKWVEDHLLQSVLPYMGVSGILCVSSFH